MNDKPETNLIQVEIFGQVYKVRGEEDQGYIEELARYVDSKMAAIAETTGMVLPPILNAYSPCFHASKSEKTR